MLRDTPEVVAIKLRSNVSQLSRTFSTLLHDLERRQSKPLMQRPSRPPDAPPKGEPPKGGPFAEEPPDDTPDMPEDVALRPDGTPGTLAAYAPKPPPEPVVIPREAPIMVALASRPKPWRQVNGEPSATPSAEAPPGEAPPDGPKSMRGPVDVTEKHLGGDAWARFASARLDPNAPDEPLRFDHEDSVCGTGIDQHRRRSRRRGGARGIDRGASGRKTDHNDPLRHEYHAKGNRGRRLSSAGIGGQAGGFDAGARGELIIVRTVAGDPDAGDDLAVDLDQHAAGNRHHRAIDGAVHRADEMRPLHRARTERPRADAHRQRAIRFSVRDIVTA